LNASAVFYNKLYYFYHSLATGGQCLKIWYEKSSPSSKDYYQAFFGVLIDLIVELLGLIINPFDKKKEKSMAAA
jgi:hypothetical protein